MKQQGIALAGIALAMMAAPAESQVYKCEGEGGTAYQQQPCSPGTGEAIQEISVVPGASEEQRQQMARSRRQVERARNRRESERHQQRIDSAQAEVRSIQRENADPKKCADSRSRLMLMDEAGVPDYSTDLFITRTAVQLYCNP